jgi:hypothetical protein
VLHSVLLCLLRSVYLTAISTQAVNDLTHSFALTSVLFEIPDPTFRLRCK